jgi:hypothetical protein
MKFAEGFTNEAFRPIPLNGVADTLAGDNGVSILARLDLVRDDPGNERTIGMRLPLRPRFSDLKLFAQSKFSLHEPLAHSR